MRRAIILTAAVVLTVSLTLFLQGYGVRTHLKPCTYWNGIYTIKGENRPSDCPWIGRPYFIIR